jgi:4-hydroxy-tetrahydrodipicolinate reductase
VMVPDDSRGMAVIDVVVHGATGKMGRDVITALTQETDMRVVGAVGLEDMGESLSLPGAGDGIPYSRDITQILDKCKPHVMVDFTNAEACMSALPQALRRGIHPVIGSTGLNDDDLARVYQLDAPKDFGVFIAPNFTIGAVLLMQLAKKAAPFFDYVDVFEMHHENKLDAPSGTAISIARAIAQGREFKRPSPKRESLPGSRGAEYKGIGIHSSRMPGKLAYHEAVFGTDGQVLSIKHDTVSRECYMPGVILAVRKVSQLKGLVVGLENLLDL